MSFLTTRPEALSLAAGDLQTIAAALNAQNAAAAGPITGLAPAAADEVSALQATQFSAYGTLYQQISAQAAAMQEMFIHTLRVSADSYGETETANSAAAAPAAAGLGTATGLGDAGTGAAVDPTFGLGTLASNGAILAAMQATNVGSATSAFTGLGTGFITNPSGVVHHVEGVSDATLMASSTPAAGAGPVAAAAGQGGPANKLPAPSGWAAEPEPATPARPLVATGPVETEAHGATTVPAGAPAVASSDRGGPGFGRPRYGVKPVVMPRKPIV
ncbi:PE family protein [[Mycobacterium] kokjensenii]|uniref:PE family protein n=1 Tax=[Mycobacterium] kokjensenii TaxID=3064287 RepID=A0ABM9L8W8_9MYCO|nr:PE family protein [Mycolicibacter sp. MU0083]CAJ1494813.1 PE family protein [Mycolicibacter sp. MU0083]